MKSQLPQKQIFQEQQEEEDTNLKDYWSVFKRRWWLILLMFLVVVGSTAVCLVWTPRQYEAATVVEIPTSGGGGLAVALGAFLPVGPTIKMATEIEKIKGRNIAEKVIRDLKLDKKEKNLERDRREIVSGFQKTLKVKQRGQTNLIEITATGDSAEEAKDIANNVADEYIQLFQTSSQKTWNDMINQMEAKLQQARADMEKSRHLLHDYEAEEGITTAFSSLLIGAGTSTGGYTTQYTVPEVPQAVAQLKAGIMEMEVQLEVMRKSLSEADPKVISLKKQIAVSRQKLEQEEKKAIEKYNKQFGLTRVAAEVVFNQQLYSMLVSKQEELKAQYIMQNKSPEITETAVEPLRPSKPKKKLILMLGGVLGLILGSGFAFFLERIDNTFRTEQEVKRYLELPLLGSVPVIKSQPTATANPVRLSEQESRMLTRLSPKAPEAEAYRMLATNIQFAKVDKPIHTLLITSPIPREGKTIIATNLAVAMAQSGKKTLLVDTDLRKPMIHRLFELEKAPGLTDFLVGSVETQEIIKNSQVDNLSVITSGTALPNAPQLLASEKMENLIQELKERFEIIIFDSSSVTVVTDPAVLGSKLDAICLVVEAERTDRDVVLKAKQLLTAVDANLLGIILNEIDVRKSYGGYHYYHYYYYYADDHKGGRGRKKKSRL